MKTYISFGQAHEHVIEGLTLNRNVLLEIDGDENRAGNIARILFGQQWSNLYPEEKVRGNVFANYPGGIVRLDDWSDDTYAVVRFVRRVQVSSDEYINGRLIITDSTDHEIQVIYIEGGNGKVYDYDKGTIRALGNIKFKWEGQGPCPNVTITTSPQ